MDFKSTERPLALAPHHPSALPTESPGRKTGTGREDVDDMHAIERRNLQDVRSYHALVLAGHDRDYHRTLPIPAAASLLAASCFTSKEIHIANLVLNRLTLINTRPTIPSFDALRWPLWY
ncbi:hypothetical protein D9619_009136 [Psilocybe cf. subviscida]|uniref:Uncharacterized protein n=1 Tax=Psilocybe cf. subviscida TaxID=2480587 RepID=A0A8H5BVJ4_9AGAR|nr:hypothetical protein D9619_009136 [Psilocybe cf. subviscida]